MKRDFSDAAYSELIELVKQVESEQWNDFTDMLGDSWNTFETWIGTLNIDNYLDDVNRYHKKVIDKNDASKETIDKIFSDVKNIDQNYAVRFTSCKMMLEELSTLVNQFTEVISPANAVFNPGNLDSVISEYKKNEKYLKILSTDGLAESDLEDMDAVTKRKLVNGITSAMGALLPNISVGESVEIPIGPGASIYYTVESEIKGDSDFDLNLIVEDQKIKFKDISYLKENSGMLSFGVKAEADSEVTISMESETSTFSYKNGKIEGTASMKIDNDIYTIKLEGSLQEIVYEESIETEFEAGSVTSAIGLKQKPTNNWTPLPIPIPETKPVSIPRIESPDLTWEHIAVIGIITIGGMAAIAMAPGTGGASLSVFLVL